MKNDLMEYSQRKTYKNRVDIGFDSLKEKWQSAKSCFTDDKLVINGHPVMESWEEEYMEVLANIATSNGGLVLEVGYGMGISAKNIQQSSIDKHIIIEANAEVFKRAQEFAMNSNCQVDVIFGFWEDITKNIANESLSGILFDTYPLVEEDLHRNHFSFFKEAHRMLKNNGILTYYSDEIQEFSALHLQYLHEAGFIKIKSELCRVNPPTDCKYWNSQTILAPIIVK